jgi:pimeloyl-ACP methyl ester carboxylesterase
MNGGQTALLRAVTDEGVTVTACPVREPSGGETMSVGFVHGLGATEAIWNPLIELLPAQVGVCRFGLPWDSAQGYRWALESHSRTWLERAFSLIPEPPDILVAHSFGANVLLDYLCAGGSAGGRGLVLMSPFYRPAPDAFDWAVLSHYVNDFAELLADGIAAQRTGAPAAERVTAMAEKIRDRIGPYGWLRFFELFSGTPMLNLAAVTAPCLVIGGTDDTASYPDDCQNLACALPDAAVRILPRCGHFTMIEEPRAVATLVVGFLHDRCRSVQAAGPALRLTKGARR